jgi:voltage-gated potassium channel Kch
VKLPKYLLFQKIIAEVKWQVSAILFLILGGTIALARVEDDFDTFTAFYYLIVTIATVGYGDETVSSREGQIVTIVVIVLGIAIISLSISSIGNRIIKNMVNHDFRYEQAIRTYENHVIIVGYNDIGRRIASYLSGWHMRIVVIDLDLTAVQSARDDQYAAIQGDISNPRELQKLNIKYARGMVLAIRNPDVTLFSAQAVKLANPDVWVISEAEVRMSAAIYKRVGISAAMDRFAVTQSKIRGIIWGLEIEKIGFSMGDGTTFFQVPNLKRLKLERLIKLGFEPLGITKSDAFEMYSGVEQLQTADYILIGGPAKKSRSLTNAMKKFVPKDADGVRRVMIVGYGEYAESILPTTIKHADEVVVIEKDEELRRKAKKDGGAQVQVRPRPSKDQLKVVDILFLTSKAAGSMLTIALEAKQLNKQVKIYARSAMTEHVDIFQASGSDFVFSPEVDLAVQLSSKVIDLSFNTQAIPYANGHLLFHDAKVPIKHVKKRQILAVYRKSKDATEFFSKKSKKQGDIVLEFVTFKKNILR